MTSGKEVDVGNGERHDGQQFLEVGNVDEVPAGKMKHVEVRRYGDCDFEYRR